MTDDQFTTDVHVNAVPATETFVALDALSRALTMAVPGWSDTESAKDVQRILRQYAPIIMAHICPNCGKKFEDRS